MGSRRRGWFRRRRCGQQFGEQQQQHRRAAQHHGQSGAVLLFQQCPEIECRSFSPLFHGAFSPPGTFHTGDMPSVC